jgi:hypothetical protein
MATVLLQYAGAAVGGFLGGPVGAILGRAAGAVAGNIIDRSLFGGTTRRAQGPRIDDLRVMSSSEGRAIPRLWGRMRVAGEVIWATNFEEVVTTRTDKTSSKGGGSKTKITEYNYFANFAAALCEGEIDRVGRVWADGKELDISELTTRLYTGSETQQPDSLITAIEGAGNAPAYRGLAYIVFERMPINDFGNRLPQLSFEVVRPAGAAETKVKAVNIIPGSTEFGYDTVPQIRELGGGIVESENAHASGIRSDWTVSIDELTATCPNLAAASLVVAWFGDDLRCASATVRPGVEVAAKQTEPDLWKVAGLSRSAAHVVSLSGGGPAFGGTPSDHAVVRAIQDLKARGLAAVFYPFILMDIAPGNGLSDPYGGAEQAPYPWRGRITCHPAPGQPGTVDKTAACATQVSSFIGTALPSHFAIVGSEVVYSGPVEWSYRRMVLHYAFLCALAGGVDAFLIGSELRGLTTLRAAGNAFPFVAALATLAAEVKAILPAAKVSYAADWSEYFGHQPADGTGDVFFHLDPVWSSAAVDFVGLDNYMPLTDWRDGHQHADRLAGVLSIYDRAYLAAGIAGGEGYDWFYASPADRDAQARTPITDGAYGKPWVFRYKDVKSWWLNPHHDRPGGIEQGAPTAWVPQSKPVWLTEAGCPAVDKGTNQPNLFFDAKSSESGFPYYSSGQRDDLILGRHVEALADYWGASGAHNPVSSLYGAPMVDAARIFNWAWDARPFPYFPARGDLWADAPNYARGHWLNGRIGAVPLGRLIEAVCAAYGFTAVDAGEVEGLVDGFLIDRPMSARQALEGVMAVFAIDAVERDGVLKFRMRRSEPVLTVADGDFAEGEPESPVYALTRAQETELPATVRLSYIESALDYRRATVEAQERQGESARENHLELPCAVGQEIAQARAEILLQEAWSGRDAIALGLAPSRLELEPGDVVTLGLSSGDRQFRIEEIADGEARRLKARHYQMSVFEAPEAPSRAPAAGKVAVYGTPDAAFLDLPIAIATAAAHAPWLAASAKPWPGTLALYRLVGANYVLNRAVEAAATKGALTEALPAGPLYVFDRATSFTVRLEAGALSAVSEAQVLQGANVAAVGSPATGFEILQFAGAELVGTDAYRLSVLLRGQSGSEPEVAASRAAGERFVLLNGAVVQPVLSLADAGLPHTWKLGPAQYDINRKHLTLTTSGKMLGLRPLSPCQLRARRDGADVVFDWIRRTRIDGDSWEAAEVPLGEESEAYVLDILDGPAVKRSASLSAPTYRYLAADIAADFGTAPSSFSLRVAQMSAVFGRGANLVETVDV